MIERANTPLTRFLAVAGTALLWLPLLAPLVLGLIVLVMRGAFHLDYLMPAELALLAAIGGALVLWASIRTGTRPWWVAASLAIAFAALVGGQLWAMASGLASGAIEAAGWPWMLALGSIAVYTLGIIVAAVLGTMLASELFRGARS